MSFAARLAGEIDQFKRDGVYKRLNFLDSPQGPHVRMEGRGDVLILSSNNYLGLSNVPEVVAAGKSGLDRFGAGTGSVRFICGTFTVHRELEQALAGFVAGFEEMGMPGCPIGTLSAEVAGRNEEARLAAAAGSTRGSGCWPARWSGCASAGSCAPKRSPPGWPRRCWPVSRAGWRSARPARTWRRCASRWTQGSRRYGPWPS